MFVVGQGLDLAASLGALSRAKAEGAFASAMLARIDAARAKLGEIGKLVAIAEVDQMLAAAAGITAATWKESGAEAIGAAGASVREATQQLAAREDGSNLQAIDSLVPATGAYRGAPAVR
jgi:hypothetical protein